MAYSFDTQKLGYTKAMVNNGEEDAISKEHKITQINATLSSADSLMSAMNDLYGIVGFSFDEVKRTVTQNVNDDE